MFSRPFLLLLGEIRYLHTCEVADGDPTAQNVMFVVLCRWASEWPIMALQLFFPSQTRPGTKIKRELHSTTFFLVDDFVCPNSENKKCMLQLVALG